MTFICKFQKNLVLAGSSCIISATCFVPSSSCCTSFPSKLMPKEALRPNSAHLHLRNPRHVRLKLTAQFLHVILGGNEVWLPETDPWTKSWLSTPNTPTLRHWQKHWRWFVLTRVSKRICWIRKIKENWEHWWIVICFCFQRIMNTPDGHCFAIDLEHPGASRGIDSFSKNGQAWCCSTVSCTVSREESNVEYKVNTSTKQLAQCVWFQTFSAFCSSTRALWRALCFVIPCAVRL